MINFKFDDRKDIEGKMASNYVNQENPEETIRDLARYNYHVLKMKKEDNYDAILAYMTKNCSDFYEENYFDVIGYVTYYIYKSNPIDVYDLLIIQENENFDEYVQGLHNQKLPYDQGKAFFTQKLCKFVAQQAIIAKAAMCADNNQACSKCIKYNNIYRAWQQNGWEQA